MADEKDLLDDPQDGGIQVEVVPEAEEERPRLRSGDTRSLDVRDDEIKGYGREVQDRIKKLRFAFHEERRQREQKERDLATTNDMAQRLFRENQQLKQNVQRGEQAVVHQALTRVDAEIAQARQAAREAYDSGKSEDIVTSSEKLARAVAERDRLALLQSEPAAVEDAPPPAAPQPPPQQDERTRAWYARNPWWDKPGEEERTGYLMGVHKSLVSRGVTAASNPDLYWKTIDEKLATKFPEYTNGNGHGSEDREPATISRPLAVAGGTRSNAGTPNATRARVIRLSESQVRVARKLGLTPEQYAHQLAIEEGMING